MAILGNYIKTTVIQKQQQQTIQWVLTPVQFNVVVPSYDENLKHVETIVKLNVNNSKITVTFYNTTQRVKVEGRGYVVFDSVS